MGQPILAAGCLSGGQAGWKAGLQALLPAPRQDGIPMSLTLPERWDSGLIVGRTPLGGALWATGRPRPALASKNQASATIEEPARGPAGPEGTPEGVRPTK